LQIEFIAQLAARRCYGRYLFSQSAQLKLILIGPPQLPSQSAARSLFGFVVAPLAMF
jgi:hypothetical protein